MPVTSHSPNASKTETTRILRSLRAGGAQALERLYALIYEALSSIASPHLPSDCAARPLHPPALVHETFLELVDPSGIELPSRARFFEIASRALRRVLVDRARREAAEEPGGAWGRIALKEGAALAGVREIDVLELDDALQRFSRLDERAARVVELRIFAGMAASECAEVLGISPRSVENDWAVARMWLGREIHRGSRA